MLVYDYWMRIFVFRTCKMTCIETSKAESVVPKCELSPTDQNVDSSRGRVEHMPDSNERARPIFGWIPVFWVCVNPIVAQEAFKSDDESFSSRSRVPCAGLQSRSKLLMGSNTGNKHWKIPLVHTKWTCEIAFDDQFDDWCSNWKKGRSYF